MAHTPEMDAHIADLALDLQPMVDEIESGVKTTQNHYGRYMSVLAMSKDDRGRNILAHALVKAGANRPGVVDAMKAIG